MAARLARILRSGLPDTNPIPGVLWRLMDHSVPKRRRPTKRLSRLLAEALEHVERRLGLMGAP